MPTLKCPFANCEEQVVNTDKGVATALFNTHTSAHTVDTGRVQGNGPKKSEELSRPKVTQGMLVEAWSPPQVLWKLYKKQADLSEAECSPQLIYCCDEELREQLRRADPNVVIKLEMEQLQLIRKLAGVPIVMGVRLAETLNRSQETQPSQELLTREFRAKYTEEGCHLGS